MKNIIQEIKDCSSVRINCCLCGAGERVYFIPESIISKLEVVVAKMETTTPTATCKDSLQVGNIAAMREALLMVKKLFDGRIMFQPAIREAHNAVRVALAEPPRNCDVGTAEEQGDRFILFCRRNSFRGVCNDSCKFANVNRRLGWQKIGQARCFPFWAQMPYESGVK